MSETLVSLMMPAWRPRAEWLGEAVRSALAQTGCAVELVLIDDGSPVSVADLLEGLDDPRLRIIRIDHRGEARARNSGIAAARGDYLRFIDADDVIEPSSTSLLLGLCEGRRDLIAYGATMFCDEDLRPLWKMTSEVEGNGVTACLLGGFQTRLTAFLFPQAGDRADRCLGSGLRSLSRLGTSSCGRSSMRRSVEPARSPPCIEGTPVA